VSSFDGATLVLATRQGGSVKVQTSGSTAVTKAATGTLRDIVPDVAVVVSGPVNPDGSYGASNVVVGALGNRGGRAGSTATRIVIGGRGQPSPAGPSGPVTGA
jgi:hypothetical protein